MGNSLMWNPCFSFDRREKATIFGWERKFHFWTTVARGTPERPGLGLCLESGKKNTTGIAYRLDAQNIEKDLDEIWSREMDTGIYKASWLQARLHRGRQVLALTFIVNKFHEQYSGPFPPQKQAKIIAAANGKYGSCRDYLADTVSSLKKIDVFERDLIALLEAVDGIN